MRALLKNTYKSLEPFESEELSNFTVITGKNGSGKSQLLDLIMKKSQHDQTVLGIDLVFEPRLSKVQVEGIAKLGTVTVNSQKWKEILNNKFNRYTSLGVDGKNLIDFIIRNKKRFLEQNSRDQLYSDDIDYINLLKKFSATVPILQRFAGMQNIPPDDEKRILSHLKISDRKFYDLIEQIAKESNKEISDLAQSDFYTSSMSEAYIDESDLFNSQIEIIFYNYTKRREKNSYNYFRQKEYSIPNGAIPDTEFLKENTPPWTIINHILDSHKIDFYFRAIDIAKFDSDADLDFQLIKKSSGKNIPFADLSSGEKTIIGLILKLFTTEYYGNNLSFPELILLDEPDSLLHPEMSKMLIDVLDETFVNKFNIKVIITTHSPSTIALCPENSIYQLTNGTNTTLKSISKDDALKLLTDFIPTLSIDYKSHRQVFVESPTDVTYFQYINDKHSQYVKLDHRLYFIANSYGKGNCSQVYKIVKEIRGSGNKTSYGIVDWDKGNEPADYVFVHGIKSRYSVENYLLDPIYITILLIDLNNAHETLQKLGLDKTINQYSLGEKNVDELQKIVEQFFKDFEARFPTFKADAEKVQVKYLNGKILNLPGWYLVEQGHNLADKLKEIYPALKKYRNEGEMQETLSMIAAKCYPLVPSDSIEIIESLGT